MFGGFAIAISIVGAAFAILTNWGIVVGWGVVIQGRFSLFIVVVAFGHAALLLMINTKNSLVRSSRIGLWLSLHSS